MMIALVNLVLISLMLLIPLIKSIAKWSRSEGPQCCSMIILEKVQYVVSVVYIFLIQQTCLIMFFSFKYGKITRNVSIFVFYILSLIFFIYNHRYSAFTFFRSYSSQNIIVLSKIISPIFIVFAKESHFIALILIFGFYSIDLMATHKNINKSLYNRFLLMKIYALFTILTFILNYIIQLAINNSKLSQGFGILSTIVIIGLINLLVIEVVIQIK